MGTLGQIIRQRRQELGLTQDDLADRLGPNVRQAEISRLEHGRIGSPRRERLEQLAAALDLPVGYLLAHSGWASTTEVGAGPAAPSDGDRRIDGGAPAG